MLEDEPISKPETTRVKCIVRSSSFVTSRNIVLLVSPFLPPSPTDGAPELSSIWPCGIVCSE